MQIIRSRRNGVVISLVAMIDVLMIMLVFFMVTSTYLDLDMIPLAEGGDPPPTAPGTTAAAPGAPFMIRVGADGTAWLRGQAMPPATLTAAVNAAQRAHPTLEVLVLPSGQADVQALVSVMDAIAASGVQRMRIIRLEGRQ